MKKILIAALMALIVLPAMLYATIVLPPIDGPIVKKIPIFIPDLVGLGTSDARAREFAEVLRNDLLNAGLFDVQKGNAIFLGAGDNVNYQAFFDAGAEALVKGEFQVSGGKITITAKLFDVVAEKFLVGRVYEATSDRVRDAAHKFANLVMKELTGIDGFFTYKIAFVSGVEDRRDLFLMDYDGFGLRRITNHRALVLSPHCSPDGSKILFNSDKVFDQDLYSLSLGGKGVEQRLTRTFRLEQSPEWSPDGSKMAFSAAGDIYIANPDGSSPVNITRHPSIDVSPAWSPDGSRIAFTSDRSGSPQIYVMSAKGGSAKRISSGSYNTDPAWSPNPEVNKIAYVRVGGGANIITVSPDGSGERQLTEGGRNENPAWSPDGHYIAFMSSRNGTRDIFLMYLSGDNIQQLTKGSGKAFPTWCR
ncbi:MAG: hypothetical protein ACT4NX_04945 [Deltaproteobacteria bacterium]